MDPKGTPKPVNSLYLYSSMGVTGSDLRESWSLVWNVIYKAASTVVISNSILDLAPAARLDDFLPAQVTEMPKDIGSVSM